MNRTVQALLYTVFLMVFTISPAWGIDADSILGIWNTLDDDAQFEIYKCGGYYCGRIYSLQEPNYPPSNKKMAGQPKVDSNNPDPRFRKRPLVGLPLMIGFSYEGVNIWKGAIYNPEDGKTYKCRISLAEDNRLKIRGYLGITVFGKTEVWTRARS
ncbi:MAG: DUF2147 domain-containing protein [Syntrophobacteraceae bacterium]